MRLPTILFITVSAAAFIAGNASAQYIAPSALLTIDQNRATVIERVVGEWGDRLASSNAAIPSAQLRQILSGLRSDHLLAASLAGSVEGLRDVVSAALVRTDAVVSRTLMHTKSLGDTTDDLVYTPVVPCRIVDTRSGAGGVFLPQTQRDWLTYSPGGFASQGGSATSCGIPVRPVAVMMNTTLANTVGGPEFFELWPFNQTRPTAATVNWSGPGQQPANAEIVPLCTGTCASDFSAYASGQTQAIIDVLGYFNRPTNYGGTHVITGVDATDSGGFQNAATGGASTVAGGFENIASIDFSTVGGGATNVASGLYSTIAGGASNSASSLYSTVAGGGGNTASGSVSTVAGGYHNVASGVGSFAAGQFANANVDGCFAFGDNSTSNVVTCGVTPNQFVARAVGGVYFLTGGNSDATYTGAALHPGATAWTVYSDRNGKNNIRAIKPSEVLRKLASIPIATWSWKHQDASIRHMGPMAQDFHAAFGLGETEKGISTVDADGVAFAAIQGLHQMLQEKNAKLQQQSRDISELRHKLRAIEAKLGL
jgi:Chaperone of endosialidase